MGRDSKVILLPKNKRFDFKLDDLRGVLDDVKIDWTIKERKMIEKIKKEKEFTNDKERKN